MEKKSQEVCGKSQVKQEKGSVENRGGEGEERSLHTATLQRSLQRAEASHYGAFRYLPLQVSISISSCDHALGGPWVMGGGGEGVIGNMGK